MKKFAVSALLFGTLLSAEAATWVLFNRTAEVTRYFDSSTIRKRGNMAKIWVLTDIQKSRPGVPNMRSLMSQAEIDCMDERMRTVAAYEYPDQMGKGQVTTMQLDADWSNWAPIIPDSEGVQMMRAACK